MLNAVVSLASETARAGYGALVFASSRYGCEYDARWIARVMPTQDELDPDLVEKRVDLLAELRSLGTGLDPVLEETVPMGVAFHRKSVCVAVNTSTDDFTRCRFIPTPLSSLCRRLIDSGRSNNRGT